MGALHEGHLSLIRKAKSECSIVVASIFVNPTQFNSLEDLEKYPRSLESDLRMLIMSNCDAVFIPEVHTIYPEFPEMTTFIHLDLNQLDTTMEGVFRPGHFEGVVNVVYRLFDIIKPDKAFFGEKDFQQLTIIKYMVEQLALPLEIIACETLREKSGLAMSSRNQRLSEKGREEAALIYQVLTEAKSLSGTHKPEDVVKICSERFINSPLKLEYLAIADPKTLQKLSSDWVPKARCFIAAYCEGVRLIDNIELIA
jgi:pantoate--beta-alanine ligase